MFHQEASVETIKLIFSVIKLNRFTSPTSWSWLLFWSSQATIIYVPSSYSYDERERNIQTIDDETDQYK